MGKTEIKLNDATFILLNNVGKHTKKLKIFNCIKQLFENKIIKKFYS